MPSAVVTLARLPGTSDDEVRAFAQCLMGQMFEGPLRDREKDGDREVPDLDQLMFTLHDVPDANAAREAVARAADGCDADWQRLYRLG